MSMCPNMRTLIFVVVVEVFTFFKIYYTKKYTQIWYRRDVILRLLDVVLQLVDESHFNL